MTLEVLARSCDWAERPAFHCPDRTWTHGEVHRNGHRVAGVLFDAGVRPGDRVLLAGADRIELVWAVLGAARIGAVAVLVNPLLSETEHVFMVQDACPSLVMCDAELVERFDPVACTRALDELSHAADRTVAAVDVGPDTPAYALYTSGTTGRPNAALHRHSDPAGYHAAMADDVLQLRADDVLYSISKAYFAYGFGNTIVFPLFSGLLRHPRPGQADRGARRRAGVQEPGDGPVCGAQFLCRAGVPWRRRLVSVRAAGGVRGRDAAARALTRGSGRGWDGRSSTGWARPRSARPSSRTFPANRVPAASGTSCRGYEASIRDQTGADVPSGEIGSLWVRGDTVMLGYLNRPRPPAFLDDGWWPTADRASVDEHGYYHHHGRIDDIEIVGGINVSPLEVEAVVLEHPSVVEAAVAAVPDDTGATRLRCFAVMTPEVEWSAALEREILDLVRSRLSSFKVPRSVLAVDALPRTFTGKLRRHVLRSTWPVPSHRRRHVAPDSARVQRSKAVGSR